ncbi:MAG: DUF222 domain-containing protein, partial [Nocardioidaceae bacterium]
PRRAATGTGDEAAPADASAQQTLVETTLCDLPYGNRLGQALCELIEHLPTDGHPQHGATNISLVVTVEETRLRTGAGEAVLDTGGSLSVGETRRLACNAGVLPMVLAGESKILDLGTSRRLFDRYQRIALMTRDQGCVFPGCERPPAWTEAHHRIPWSEGGPTDLDNGCLLCSSTTTSSTTANGTSTSHPTGSPRSSHRPASTPNEDPSATNASNPDPDNPNDFRGRALRRAQGKRVEALDLD